MNNIKFENELQKQIFTLLGKGKHDCRPSSYFLSILHISRRAFREEINCMRKQLPIVSRDTAPCGYFIAETEKELQEFIDSIQQDIRGYEKLRDRMISFVGDLHE